MKRELIITGDGSHSIYLPEINEQYHSVNGAIAESEHIFIERGLGPLLKKNNSISILEMGFGTGLNAFLTCLTAKSFEVKITYDALETHPLEKALWQKLNYPELLGDREIFSLIHEASWEEPSSIDALFHLTKINCPVEHFYSKPDKYKLVFYDAFAPSKQTEVWQDFIFQRIYDCMQKGGILITYAASGKFRRTLKRIGFSVESLEGPKGKREITRAFKK